MLLDIKCSAISSVQVHLTFDDQTVKDRLIAIGDLIDCVYNANGIQRHIIGRVTTISTVGSNQAGWYIIVDGSDDFEGRYARFSPMSILDVDIIRKADMEDVIRTPLGEFAVPYLRINKGRLQYSLDGFEWHCIVIDNRDIIEDAEGTVPIFPPVPPCPGPAPRPQPPRPCCEDSNDDGGIEDAIY